MIGLAPLDNNYKRLIVCESFGCETALHRRNFEYNRLVNHVYVHAYAMHGLVESHVVIVGFIVRFVVLNALLVVVA